MGSGLALLDKHTEARKKPRSHLATPDRSIPPEIKRFACDLVTHIQNFLHLISNGRITRNTRTRIAHLIMAVVLKIEGESEDEWAEIL